MVRLIVLGWLLVLAACLAGCPAGAGRGPQALGDQPSWRGGTKGAQLVRPARPVTFAPTTEAVASYNAAVTPPPPSALGDAVVRAVREAAVRQKLPPPIADARLFRACEELAGIVPEEGIIQYSLVEFALQRNGIIEPSPHLLVVWGNIDSPQLIVDQLAPRLAEIFADGATTRVGIGAARRLPDGTGAVVFALQASNVATKPVPRKLRAGGSFVLDAAVDARYRDPEVFVTRSSGATERLALRHDARRPGAFTAQVGCASSIGKQQVEITAADAQGSTVLANFPVWCGADPPSSLTVAPTSADIPTFDPVEAEKRLFGLVNRDRASAGLPTLVWDDKVAEVARGHSQEMRRTKAVAHISPTTGSAADRVRAAKIKTAVVLENVARAYGMGEAHDGLMNSPGHRANILSSAATHVGVGVVFGDEISGLREIFITQVFTRVPPKLDPVRGLEVLRGKLLAVRKHGTNAVLTDVAQRLALGMAAGQTRDQAYTPHKARIETLGRTYLRVGSIITAASDLDSLDAGALIGDAVADDIGIGLAQGPHPELGDNAIWIVLLVASRRTL